MPTELLLKWNFTKAPISLNDEVYSESTEQPNSESEEVKYAKTSSELNNNTKSATASKEHKKTAPVVKKKVPNKKPTYSKSEERAHVKHRLGTSELKKGFYLVVGAFQVRDNAVRFNNRVKKKGYESKIGYSSDTHLYYIYCTKSTSLKEARFERTMFRQKEKWDNWVLIIE